MQPEMTFHERRDFTEEEGEEKESELNRLTTHIKLVHSETLQTIKASICCASGPPSPSPGI